TSGEKPAGPRRSTSVRRRSAARGSWPSISTTRAGLGTGLDRHEHIGQGFLGGRSPFRRLLNDPRFARVPKVIETAKEPEPIAALRNPATLRRLRGGRG